jgi:hypothetical protein
MRTAGYMAMQHFRNHCDGAKSGPTITYPFSCFGARADSLGSLPCTRTAQRPVRADRPGRTRPSGAHGFTALYLHIRRPSAQFRKAQM